MIIGFFFKHPKREIGKKKNNLTAHNRGWLNKLSYFSAMNGILYSY